MSSTTITGLGSGLDYSTWISKLVNVRQEEIDKVSAEVGGIKEQKSVLDVVEAYYKDFLESIELFTDALSDEDLFNQMGVESSSDAVTAEVTNSAVDQELTVSVSQLATCTKASSTYAVAAEITETTAISDISDGSINSGTFSIYVDGQKHDINVGVDEASDTLGEIISAINNIEGVSARIGTDPPEEGKFIIEADGSEISVGAGSDTSNFVSVMALNKEPATGDYVSSKALYTTSSTEALVSTDFQNSLGAPVSVTEGTFSINGIEFSIDSSTTMNKLCKEISESDAEVTASWDSNSGKLIILSEDEGAFNIDIEAGSSNFTDVMGLTSLGALVSGSQTLGDNAVFNINGTTITSTSNTVTSDVTGVNGLTLTLNSVTDEEDDDTTLTIGHDNSGVAVALENVINAYNKVMDATDTVTATDGYLYGERILENYRNNIREQVSFVLGDNGDYTTLFSIGISSGEVGDLKSATNQLSLDKEKLTEALKADADSVKRLLVGDKTTDGVLDKLKTILDKATNPVSGYFVSAEESFDDDIERLNKKIEKMNKKMETYEADLYDKYNKMDELIAKYESQLATFKSYFDYKKDDDDD